VTFVAVHFKKTASTLQSGDSGLTLKNLTERNYKGQESVIHGSLRKYQGSKHDVSVCSSKH